VNDSLSIFNKTVLVERQSMRDCAIGRSRAFHRPDNAPRLLRYPERTGDGSARVNGSGLGWIFSLFAVPRWIYSNQSDSAENGWIGGPSFRRSVEGDSGAIRAPGAALLQSQQQATILQQHL
jgi:hypothetical protein